jgi:hypothetical protein
MAHGSAVVLPPRSLRARSSNAAASFDGNFSLVGHRDLLLDPKSLRPGSHRACVQAVLRAGGGGRDQPHLRTLPCARRERLSGQPPRRCGRIRGGPGARARSTRLHGGAGAAARGWRGVPDPDHGAGAGDPVMAAPAPSPSPGGGVTLSPDQTDGRGPSGGRGPYAGVPALHGPCADAAPGLSLGGDALPHRPPRRFRQPL